MIKTILESIINVLGIIIGIIAYIAQWILSIGIIHECEEYDMGKVAIAITVGLELFIHCIILYAFLYK